MTLQTLVKSAWAAVMAGGLVAIGTAQAKCIDELSPQPRVAAVPQTPAPKAGLTPEVPPEQQLQMIAREATKRSAAVGASQWLATAASHDVAETKAARMPQVTLNGGYSIGTTRVEGDKVSSGGQATLGVNAAAPLYDFGRLKSLIEWRKELERAARFGVGASQEQVVLEAVTTALEFNRYRLQAQVYQQYVRKMSCLVESLEKVVAEDKGRASELVQARKTQAQAELSRDSAVAQGRQIELKLRKLLGDDFRPGEGIIAPLSPVPALGELHRLLEQSSDARQLRLQASAQDSYVEALRAGQKPQVNWSVTKTKTNQKDLGASAWQANVNVSYTLYDGDAAKSSERAALARAEAARQQYAEFVASRQERISEVHDIATTAFDRARRYVDVIRDSDKVRNFTFQQWSQMGRRSLFDLMSAESEYFNLRIAYVNALHDGFEANAQLRSMGGGLAPWLAPESTVQQ